MAVPRKSRLMSRPPWMRIRSVSEFLRAFASIPQASATRRRLRQIAAPLLPILGFDPSIGTTAVLYRKAIRRVHAEAEAIAFELQRAKLSGPGRLATLVLREVPRLAALIKAEQSAVALVDKIGPLARRLEERVRAGQYRLVRQFRRDPKAYFAPIDFIRMPSFVEGPGDFAIVVDFTAGRSMAPFLAALLGAFEGRSMRAARTQILNQLKDAGFQLVIGPKRARLQRRRGITETIERWQLADMLARSLRQHLGPMMQKVWREVILDFFLKEPSSVSRWFPQRPMARKGLQERTRRTSLLGMLLTGKVEFQRVGSHGFAGAFTQFEVQRAPYWPVVQYGYPGVITPRERKYLALQDPPGWRSVLWFFGAPVTAPKFSERGIRLHTGLKRSFFYSAAIEQATVRTALPASGTRFWFRMKNKEATKPFVPAVSMEVSPVLSRKGRRVVTFALKTQITYSATKVQGKKPVVFQRKVQGQRPSMFIERILARFAERQDELLRAIFQAARAYVELGDELFAKFLRAK
jgi:hypothetical protein